MHAWFPLLESGEALEAMVPPAMRSAMSTSTMTGGCKHGRIGRCNKDGQSDKHSTLCPLHVLLCQLNPNRWIGMSSGVQ